MTTTTTHWTITRPTIEGAAIRVMRRGTGPALLFLHGTDAFTTPPAFLDDLAQRFDVIVPDHPGFGESETPPWLDTIGDLVHVYRSLLETLGVRDVVLAGHDIGGWIAAELALRDATGIRSLILIDSAGLPLVTDGVDTFMCSTAELRAASFAHPDRVPLPDDAAVAQQAKNRLMTARLGWQPRFYDPQLAKWLHRLTVPTLIVWGADDQIFPPAQADAFTRAIRGSRSVIIPDTGHLPHVEAPRAFTDAVLAFTNGVPS